MKVLGIARLLAEAGVVIGQKTGQQFIAGGDRADPAKTQFLDQAILQGPVGTLNPALGLARIGTDDVDVQRMQRPAELGHAVAFDRARAVDPEDAVLVAVECDRLAMRLEIFSCRLKVVEGRFRLDELQVHQAAGGVVDIDEQSGLRTSILEPPVFGTVNLHQFAQTIASRPRLVDALQPVFPPNPKAGADHPLPQGLDTEIQAVNLGQLPQARQLVAAHRDHRHSTPPRSASRKPKSVTSQSVRPVTFPSVTYMSCPRKIQMSSAAQS